MKCYMNGVVIHKVPTLLAPVPTETTHAIQIMNPFDVTHPMTIPLKATGVTSYFDVRKSTQEEYEDLIILKIELTMEAQP